LSPELEAYQDGPVGVLRRMARAGYLAPGDPAKMAKARLSRPALHSGGGVYGYIETALNLRLTPLSSSKDATMSTDCGDAAAG